MKISFRIPRRWLRKTAKEQPPAVTWVPLDGTTVTYIWTDPRAEEFRRLWPGVAANLGR